MGKEYYEKFSLMRYLDPLQYALTCETTNTYEQVTHYKALLVDGVYKVERVNLLGDADDYLALRHVDGARLYY